MWNLYLLILHTIIFYRYNGRRILASLMSHPDFNKMLEKHLPANTLRNTKEVVENIRTKVYISIACIGYTMIRHGLQVLLFWI